MSTESGNYVDARGIVVTAPRGKVATAPEPEGITWRRFLQAADRIPSLVDPPA